MSDGPPLNVVSWNVLAAPWVAPRWYPEQMDGAVLDRARRAPLVGAALRALAPDIALLQETTPPDLERILHEWGAPVAHRASANGPELWRNWLDTPDDWEPNGTAVVWRADRFAARRTESVALASSGNTATLVELDDAHGATLLVVSVHLDSDDATTRRREVPAIVDAVGDAACAIVAGDWNEDVVVTGLAADFLEHGFVDVAAALGARAPTYPYARPGDDWAGLATIDHMLVRGLEARSIETVDAGTWSQAEPHVRMEQLLRSTGSDHLALHATLAG